MSKEFKKALWKRIGAGVVSASLCSAMLFMQVGTPMNVWAEGEAAQAVVQEMNANSGDTADGLLGKKDAAIKKAKKTTKKKQKISVAVKKQVYTSVDTMVQYSHYFNIGASAKTALSYKVIKGKKYISVDDTGYVTVGHATPKGKYVILVTAKATSEYKKATKKVIVKVKAPQTPDMANVNMYWDLTPGNVVGFKTAYELLHIDEQTEEYSTRKKMASGTVVVKDWNITDAKSPKRNKLKFTLEFHKTLDDFNKWEIDEVANFWAETGGAQSGYNPQGIEYFAVLDYETGANLEKEELADIHHVKVKAGEWQYENLKKYNGSTSEYWWQEAETARITVTVTYPKDYKGLCIVAGGVAETQGPSSFDYIERFMSVGEQLWSTEFKECCHGVRVR